MSQSLAMTGQEYEVEMLEDKVESESPEFDFSGIVDEISLRVIQEELKNKNEEMDAVNYKPGKKSLGVAGIASTAFLIGPGLAAALTDPSALGLYFVSALAIPGSWGVAYIPAEEKTAKVKELKNEIYHLRKELIEKSLNVEILNTEIIGMKHQTAAEWREITVSKNGANDFFQCYVKLVKDETTGFEEVKVKMPKNKL